MDITNNECLYFDATRKKGFDKLVHAYVKTYKGEVKIGNELEEKLKKNIDKYTGTVGDKTAWGSLYTLSRELGIYILNENNEYKLSPTAEDLWNSKISVSDYLTNYLLNLNLIINNNIVHPLYELLSFIIDNESRYISSDGNFYEVTIADLNDIESFSFTNITGDNENKKISTARNNLIRRMEAARIVQIQEKGGGRLDSSKPMKINKELTKQLQEHCYIWNEGVDEFLELKDDVFITSKRNKYIYGEDGEI